MTPLDTCLIVAAGKGTRLKGFGDLKPLVNLGGMPLIEHAMMSASEAGVSRFVVVAGYKAATLIAFLDCLRAKHRWSIETVVNSDFEQSNGLSVLAAAEYLPEEFFLAMCDHVVEPGVYDALNNAVLPEGSVGLGVDQRLSNPDVDLEDVTKVLEDKGTIRSIGKSLVKYNAFDAGIFRANTSLLDAIRDSQDATGNCSISAGMRNLAERGKAVAIDIGDARWIDVDSPDMHALAHIWKHRPAFVEGPASRQKIVAVGHRGTKKFAPENTLAAHEAAFSLGARGIEFDVRCTRDGHFVLMHDAAVDRTTDGTGYVRNMRLSEIKRLDAGLRMGPGWTGERVPSLREALRNADRRFTIDIDFKGGPANSAEILANVLEEEGYSHSHLVTIFARRQHLQMLEPLCPQYALRPHFLNPRRTMKLVRTLPIEVMGLRRLTFSQRAAKSIVDAGLHLFCNVMGEDDNPGGYGDAVLAGARFIQTDNLDQLVPYLEARDLLETRVLGRDYEPIDSVDGKEIETAKPG